MSDIEGKAAREAASEWSRGDASDIDGKTEKVEWSFWEKRHRRQSRDGVAASELGSERVSNVRVDMSQCGQRVSFNGADGISDGAGTVARVRCRAERKRADTNRSAKVVGAFVSNAKVKFVVAAAVSAAF